MVVKGSTKSKLAKVQHGIKDHRYILLEFYAKTCKSLVSINCLNKPPYLDRYQLDFFVCFSITIIMMTRKLQVLLILLVSITLLFILFLLYGAFQGNYYQFAGAKIQQSFKSTSLMRPFIVDYEDRLIESLREMGYTLSDLPDQSELWTENVELCIMFNLNGIGVNQTVIELLIAFYHPFFSHLTFLFDGDPAETKRPKYLPSYVDVFGCDSHVGLYQHRCIQTCIQQGTNETKGFLYIADDMFINVSKMAELPTSKVWFTGSTVRKYSDIIDIVRNTKPPYWWWGPPTNSAANLEIEINNLPQEWKDQLIKTAGFPDKFKTMATSDIIYVPRTIATKLELVLSHIINTAKLFCEVATNLAVNIVAPELVLFEYGYVWGDDRSIEGINRTAQKAHFVHPIKLGGVKEHLDLWIQYMKKQLEIAILAKGTNHTVHEQH